MIDQVIDPVGQLEVFTTCIQVTLGIGFVGNLVQVVGHSAKLTNQASKFGSKPLADDTAKDRLADTFAER